jgi:hypothetical protein
MAEWVLLNLREVHSNRVVIVTAIYLAGQAAWQGEQSLILHACQQHILSRHLCWANPSRPTGKLSV